MVLRLIQLMAVAFVGVCVGIACTVEPNSQAAACSTLNCNDDCFAHPRWCQRGAWGVVQFDEYAKAVVPSGGRCTNGAVTKDGTAALKDLVTYDEYDDCSPDCNAFADWNTPRSSSGAKSKLAKKTHSSSGTLNTSCTPPASGP